jgi:hypothetical protein
MLEERPMTIPVEERKKNAASYVLNMPRDLRLELDRWAEEVGTTVAQLLRIYVIFGLFAHKQLKTRTEATGEPLLVILHRYLATGQRLDELRNDDSGQFLRFLVERRSQNGRENGRELTEFVV